MSLIVSVSGIRGIVGSSLTPEVALDFATAYGTPLAGKTVALSRDGRSTGPMLRDAVRAGLSAVGCHVIDLEVASTPTTGFYVKHHQLAGGVQVTASHNPPEYNGLKLFRPQGFVLSPFDGQRIAGAYHRKDRTLVDYTKLGKVSLEADPFAPHLRAVLAVVDVAKIKARRFNVTIDCNHGSGGAFAPRLLEQLGCQVTVLGGTPDGLFDHTPEPTEANLAQVAQRAKSAGSDVTFAVDPDADRLAIIDEHGNYIGEECTLALAVLHRTTQLKGQRGTIVINGSTSQMTADVALAHGFDVKRTPVGEVHVAEQMIASQAVIGGEGNGGVIDPRIGYGRDSAISMALILDLLASTGKTVSELVATLPKYAIYKDKAPIEREKLQATLDEVTKAFADGSADRSDGVRIEWDGAWVQLRASNTEPIVRIIAEAKQFDEAERLCRRVREIMSN